MKILILAAVRCSLIFTAVTASLFSVPPAEANRLAFPMQAQQFLCSAALCLA